MNLTRGVTIGGSRHHLNARGGGLEGERPVRRGVVRFYTSRGQAPENGDSRGQRVAVRCPDAPVENEGLSPKRQRGNAAHDDEQDTSYEKT